MKRFLIPLVALLMIAPVMAQVGVQPVRLRIVEKSRIPSDFPSEGIERCWNETRKWFIFIFKKELCLLKEGYCLSDAHCPLGSSCVDYKCQPITIPTPTTPETTVPARVCEAGEVEVTIEETKWCVKSGLAALLRSLLNYLSEYARLIG